MYCYRLIEDGMTILCRRERAENLDGGASWPPDPDQSHAYSSRSIVTTEGSVLWDG